MSISDLGSIPEVPPPPPRPPHDEVGVCCGCFGGSGKRRRRKGDGASLPGGDNDQSVYNDANIGRDSQWEHTGLLGCDNDSLHYFDAVDEPLGDDEYPIIFTATLQHPKPEVSMDHPESLLIHDENGNEIQNHHQYHHPPPPPASTRFLGITKRTPQEHQQQLETPRVKIPLQGYPGLLTIDELAECDKFIRGLKLLGPGAAEQVYSFREIEEEPYTICRWLRATKFNADDILARIERNQPAFAIARKNDFYPDLAEALGVPTPIFLSQYPFLAIGRAKNGCPVNYFKAGKIQPEGLLCITTMKRIDAYFWHSFLHKMKNEIKQAQLKDPDFVRCEGINIIDLGGLSASALSSETMEVIQIASRIGDYFPETLHCMLILNAPGFFSMSWAIIKKFLDPRTAQRIQVFSNTSKSLKALQQLVDTKEIPVDYGGTNTSIDEAFMQQSSDPSITRQEVELVHVKKRGKSKTKNPENEWVLKSHNESISIKVYTRSVSSGSITVTVDDKIVAENIKATCNFEKMEEDANNGNHHHPEMALPVANCTVVVQNVIGPGKIVVEVSDNDDVEKIYNGRSRGYFLICGDVKNVK